VRLTGFPLEAVDGLPVSGGDQLGLAGGQPLAEFVSVVASEVRQLVLLVPARRPSAELGSRGSRAPLEVELVSRQGKVARDP
jgi:hypothetical protein